MLLLAKKRSYSIQLAFLNSSMCTDSSIRPTSISNSFAPVLKSSSAMQHKTSLVKSAFLIVEGYTLMVLHLSILLNESFLTMSTIFLFQTSI